MAKTPADRFSTDELMDEISRPTEAQLFTEKYQQSLTRFTAEFATYTAGRFLHSRQSDDYHNRKNQEVTDSAYSMREALGRVLAMFLKDVRANRRDVQAASMIFYTHLSRIFWHNMDLQEERFENDLERRAKSMDFEEGITEDDWLKNQQRELDVFLRDTYGRLCGVVSGMSTEQLLQDTEEALLLSDNGDNGTREKAQQVLDSSVS